jgi:hypothetical protein
MTDSSQDGPEKGAPAIMPAGMMGDRASVIFAAPEEISKMIEARCWSPNPAVGRALVARVQAGGVASTDVANTLLPDNALVKFIVRSRT